MVSIKRATILSVEPAEKGAIFSADANEKSLIINFSSIFTAFRRLSEKTFNQARISEKFTTTRRPLKFQVESRADVRAIRYQILCFRVKLDISINAAIYKENLLGNKLSEPV